MSPSRILALSIGLAASVLACSSDDDDERHGIVKLELQPAQPLSDAFPDPFAGTLQIVATMQYGDYPGLFHMIDIPAGAITQRYVGAQLVLGGNTPSITASLFIAPRACAQNHKSYARGYSIE